MTSEDILDTIGAVDEPVLYGSTGYDGAEIEFYCTRMIPYRLPDGREIQNGCPHVYPDWRTPRELLEAIAEHIRDAHPEVHPTP